MKIHSRTNIPSATFEQRGLMYAYVTVGGLPLGPGEEREVVETLQVVDELRRLETLGVVGRGEHPQPELPKAPPAPPVVATPATDEPAREEPVALPPVTEAFESPARSAHAAEPAQAKGRREKN